MDKIFPQYFKQVDILDNVTIKRISRRTVEYKTDNIYTVDKVQSGKSGFCFCITMLGTQKDIDEITNQDSPANESDFMESIIQAEQTLTNLLNPQTPDKHVNEKIF